MNQGRILNFVGMALLAGCFLVAAVRVLRPREGARKDDGRVVVRIAHWQLEAGLRDAFDALAKDYERDHPGVKIEQVAIPDRSYASWLRTQLIGGTAPDILQIGRGTDDAVLARFFQPIGKEVEQPNPFNAGTALEGRRWRETFIDGLAGDRSYNVNLLDYYGVPSSVFTVRIFYNRTLWRTLLGDTPPPADYDAFIRICERVQAEARRRGENIVPITSSKEQAPLLLTRLFGSQTQQLSLRLDTLHTLDARSSDIGLGYLRGDWNLDTAGLGEGLRLVRDVGRFIQPGFMQLARDDSTFHFIQERALMIATGSWDAPSLRTQADFEIGAFTVPLPRRDHPLYGRGVLGTANEGFGSVGLVFGVVSQSPNKAEAISFLQFLTSYQGNRRFSEISGWLPSVDGVPLAPKLESFRPITDGYPDGFDLTLKSLGSETKRVVDTQLSDIMNPNVDLVSAQSVLDEQVRAAVRTDLDRSLRISAQNIRRQDILWAANYMMAETNGDSDALGKPGKIQERQNQIESSYAWTLHELTTLDAK